jgi:hypothetical protein
VAIGQQRRFTLMDGLILVAATAIGLALDRASVALFSFRNPPIREWTETCSWVVLSWTCVIGLLGLLPPRLPRRRLFRQPSMAASSAAWTACVLNVCWYIPIGIREWRNGNTLKYVLKVALDSASDPAVVSIAIAIAWSALMLSGSWRPEPSWLDRFGRALGIIWFGLFVFSSVMHANEWQ